MPKLKRIEIKGYRSIKFLDLDLESLNVMIGANGAGKSNFVSFFKLLNKMMAQNLQEYLAETGRGQSVLHFGPKATPQLESRMTFEADQGTNVYAMRLFHAAGDTLIFAEESLQFHRTGSPAPLTVSLPGAGHQETLLRLATNAGNKTAKTVSFLLDQCRVYHFHDTSPRSRPRLAGYINENRWLMHDAGNLAAMLFVYQTEVPVVYDRIKSTVRKIVPELDDFALAPNRRNPNEIMLNWRKRGYEYLFGPHQISDGSLRAMALCTLLLQPVSELPNLIVLDEPELGLHPNALEIVAGLIRAASTTIQIIVATQSQSFINYFAPAEVVTVDIRDGQTSAARLDPATLAEWLEEYTMGELWSRNVIFAGPTP